MTQQEMVRMVNQIADFYRPYPEEEAIAGIAGHIRDFWEPRMRAQLEACLASGGEGLSDLGQKAAQRLLAATQAA